MQRRESGRQVARVEPLRIEDGADLVLDALGLVEPDAVDLARGQLRRGLQAQRPCVVGVAVGKLPGAILVGGHLAQRVERDREARVCRQHHLRHRPLRVRDERRTRVVRGADGFELCVEVGDEDVLSGRLGGELRHLLADARDDEARRHDARTALLFDRREGLVERRSEAAEPRHVVPRVAFVVHLVHVQHEVGQRALQPVVLVHRVVVQDERLAGGEGGEEPLHHVVGTPLVGVERSPVVAPQRGEVGGDPADAAAREVAREVVEIVGVEVDSPRLEDAQLREDHRALEAEAREDPQIEEVDRQRARPPCVGDQCDGQDQQSDQSEERPPQQAQSSAPSTRACASR